MATQAITVTYTDGQTVAAAMGCVVTYGGQFFYNFPANDKKTIRAMCDFLRNAVNDGQTQNHGDVDGTQIGTTPINCPGF